MPKISQRTAELPASPIRKLAPLAAKALQEGKTVYNLNIGQPDIPTPRSFMEGVRNANLSVLSYSPSPGLPETLQALRGYYAEWGIDIPVQEMCVTIGGSEMVLSIKISPLNGVKGERPKIIVVTEDITEKIILEKYVILSEKMVAKGEMAAAIGHEINNHLEILTAHAELLPLHVKNNKLEKLPDSCAKILDSIDRMTRFTRGLMDYSQVDTDLVEYNLKDLIEEHLFTVRPLRRFANVQFQTDFDPDLPPVKLDIGQIQSVLLNLYNNAIDATKERESPRIDIAVAHRAEEQVVELRVTDHGRGIPPEILARLFESRFTTKKTGHGLGLANCRTIIQNHGGTIMVDSTAGVSTTFTVRLPARPPYSSFDS